MIKVGLVHNFYQWSGGEDRVFQNEEGLLKAHGHHVFRYTRHNDTVAQMGRLSLAVNTVWCRSSAAELRALIQRERPQILHFHNTLPLISPAAYYAAKAERVAVVQTLHNYRLLCPPSTLYRNGHICEDCVGHFFPWPAVVHACYRKSRAASGVVSAMLSVHRAMRTWTKVVDRFIALTEFARDKLIEGGLPAERMVVKANFVTDSGEREVLDTNRNGALFVGRISEEKGIATMLAAWRHLDIPLTILGDGPLKEMVKRGETSSICLLGARSNTDALAAMRKASFLVMPAEWYEGFPMVIVESFSQSLPVIASRLGAMAEVVEDGVTGLHFSPGDPKDLGSKVRWASEHPQRMRRMGQNARQVYTEKYTPEANYAQLIAIYESAISQAQRGTA